MRAKNVSCTQLPFASFSEFSVSLFICHYFITTHTIIPKWNAENTTEGKKHTHTNRNLSIHFLRIWNMEILSLLAPIFGVNCFDSKQMPIRNSCSRHE